MIRFLCLIATEDRLWNMRRALRLVESRHPGLAEGVFWSVWELSAHPEKIPDMLEDSQNCDFALVYFHGGIQMMEDFPKVWRTLTRRMPAYFESSLPEEIAELLPQSSLTPEEYQSIRQYFRLADYQNLAAMLVHIAHSRFGADCLPPPPQLPLEEGFYTPRGILSPEESRNLRRQAAEGRLPVAGVILHQSQILNGNTRHIDAVLTRLEELGVLALPFFTRMANDEDDKRGIRHAMDRFFQWEGKKLPQVILVLAGFSLTHMGWPGDGQRVLPESIFAGWGVPALQVMATRFSPEDYRRLPQGMDSMGLSSSVFQPELDGQIITVPCAAQTPVEEDGVERKVFVPLADRVDRVCRLAANWAKLKFLPNSEKKVAILFNTLPGNAKIGCAEGLGTFESVCRILAELKRQGYRVETAYSGGQKLADRLTAGLTNDLSWISQEEAVRRAAALVEPEIWRPWFAGQTEKVRQQLENAWGPAPGRMMLQQGKLLIPGILNGDVFIGLHPSRAFGEKAAELYHSTDATPPYSYIAYYRWPEEVFGANAVCHTDTHGSLEWLPGKEVGLSGECYSDISLGSIPHLYAYHIGVTGEGIQAKRRSWAVILDHLPPSLDEAEAYKDLAVIDEALKEYHQARQTRPAQVPQLAQRIFELAEKANLTQDLHLTQEGFSADPERGVEAIHLWMGELKHSVVKDGLRIFGQPPEGKLLDNLLRTLVRVRNGNIPSLNDSLLQAQGYDPQQIKDRPSADFGGVSGQTVYDQAIAAARQLAQRLSQGGLRRRPGGPAGGGTGFSRPHRRSPPGAGISLRYGGA